MTKLIRVKFLLQFVLVLFVLAICVWLVLARPFVIQAKRQGVAVLASPATLEAYTRKLSTDFFPRDYRHVENLNRAADWISNELKHSSQKVWFQKFMANGSEYKNIIAEYNETGDKKRETIVIGAHYDAHGEFHAADDNASGLAGLLELSRLIPLKPLPFNVVLVAYTLEEPPFFGTTSMGSAVHAASVLKSGEKVRLMISLEMIGYFSDEPNSQSYPLSLLNMLYPSKGNFIAIVGPMSLSPATLDLKAAFLRSTQLPVFSINTPSWIPGIDFSDHRNYWAAGIDAVMVTDTSFFRNHAYHTAGDTYDRLDYQKMSEVVTGVYDYLVNLGANTN